MTNKTSDKNVANVTKSDIDVLKALIYVYEARLPNYNELMDSEVKALKNILAELEQKDKKIRELEAKLEFKEFGDLDNVEFEEYMSQFIPKQDVIETLNRHKLAYEEFNIMYNNTHYEDDEIRARDFYVIVTEDRIVQVLTKLLGGEK